jgi:hypothetical protein
MGRSPEQNSASKLRDIVVCVASAGGLFQRRFDKRLYGGMNIAGLSVAAYHRRGICGIIAP